MFAAWNALTARLIARRTSTTALPIVKVIHQQFTQLYFCIDLQRNGIPLSKITTEWVQLRCVDEAEAH